MQNNEKKIIREVQSVVVLLIVMAFVLMGMSIYLFGTTSKFGVISIVALSVYNLDCGTCLYETASHSGGVSCGLFSGTGKDSRNSCEIWRCLMPFWIPRVILCGQMLFSTAPLAWGRRNISGKQSTPTSRNLL